TARFLQLRNAFIQPSRTTSVRDGANERVSKLMLERMGKRGCDGRESTDGHAQLAIKQCARPGGRLGHIKILLVVVEDNGNHLAGHEAEVAAEVVKMVLESLQDLPAKCRRRLAALIAHGEMAAVLLGKITFCGEFALRFLEDLCNIRVRRDLERALQRGYSFL